MIAAIGVLSCLAASGFASNFQRRNWLPSHGTLRTANYVKKTTPASTRNGFMKVAGVFTEEPLPDTLVEQMPNLKWLHMTRGGVNSYLTPTVKARPIQVTGSKGIHGTVFSEFALACIFALAKKLPECMEAQKQKKWQKLTPVEIEGKTLGIVGLGTAGAALARKAKALGLRVIATKRTPHQSPNTSMNWAPPSFCLSFFPSPTSLCSCSHPFHQPLTFLAPKNSGR
jgi:phosphoglycerate dehydrogenase-like enzyme